MSCKCKEDYCGDIRTPKVVRKLVSWIFWKACKFHDFLYKTGSVPRIIADFLFFFYMVYILIEIQLMFAVGIFVAPVAFLIVLIMGREAYSKEDPDIMD